MPLRRKVPLFLGYPDYFGGYPGTLITGSTLIIAGGRYPYFGVTPIVRDTLIAGGTPIISGVGTLVSGVTPIALAPVSLATHYGDTLSVSYYWGVC